MPIYEKFWLGDHHPELPRTIELAWMSVEGAALDAAEVKRSQDVANELSDIYAEDSIATLAGVANIGSYIMDVLAQAEEPAMSLSGPRAHSSLLTVSDAVDGILSREDITAPSALAEEEAWLEAAIARAETWTKPLSRDLFHDLGSFPPRWWAVYSTVTRPY